MVVGERTGFLRGRVNGVLIESEAGETLAYAPAITRRGARETWEMLMWAHQQDAALPAGAAVMYRVEHRRIVERTPLSPKSDPPDDADAGVREPRRPRPPRGGAAASARLPDEG